MTVQQHKGYPSDPPSWPRSTTIHFSISSSLLFLERWAATLHLPMKSSQSCTMAFVSMGDGDSQNSDSQQSTPLFRLHVAPCYRFKSFLPSCQQSTRVHWQKSLRVQGRANWKLHWITHKHVWITNMKLNWYQWSDLRKMKRLLLKWRFWGPAQPFS